jgi:beta-galactosidase
MTIRAFTGAAALTVLLAAAACSQGRKTALFTDEWRFTLGDQAAASSADFDDSHWRSLDLPHDWSIEGPFSKDNPAGTEGGALPGGIGWYRKTFTVPAADTTKQTFIEFDGVYRNSEVWLNGHYLGKRPYGFSSFSYELTPFLLHGVAKNVIAVRVDNSQQPNSRWYSGSGIYRNVRFVTTDCIHVEHWGTFVTTPVVTAQSANVTIHTRVCNSSATDEALTVTTRIMGAQGKQAASISSQVTIPKDSVADVEQHLVVRAPDLWSVDRPSMYVAETKLTHGKIVRDAYETPFGIRTFSFDAAKGFTLNGRSMKINGVCNHHDLGCLGAAINTRALERQLQIMKGMGVNAIRTSHNPPAPELLDLCDRMGFIVMDEAFDMWRKKKTDFDYSHDWDAWHRRDLEDMVLRDRNHPSVIMWSIGNEIPEQWDKKDSSGMVIARELAGIITTLDTTRPVTAACNNPDPQNPLVLSGALDVIGLNYHHDTFADFPARFPGKAFIGSETVSSLNSRGMYDMPSDSIRRWPLQWDKPFTDGNADNSCSSYDNCSAPWGSTHEETWKIIKKHDFLSGQFIWTGFDYLGEPTPYGWPSRSSYFGIIDIAGFPKDVYYMYQSEWTTTPVLHLFPHWNWQGKDTVDIWAYTNCDEVELFLNGASQGVKKKHGDDLHLMWRLHYAPGTLKAVGRTQGRKDMITEVKTAGTPEKIVLASDRGVIHADGKDLAFVTVKVVDNNGTVVPRADNLIHFTISGEGSIEGVDSGLQTSLVPFKTEAGKAFNGLTMVVVRSQKKKGPITLTARSEGLAAAAATINAR